MSLQHDNENATKALSPEELKQWKEAYANADNLSEHMKVNMVERNEHLDKCMARFIMVLAQMAMKKDDGHSFVKEFGRLYRWKYQYEEVMNADNDGSCLKRCENVQKPDLQKDNMDCMLMEGCRLMLQLKAGARWWDWVYIQQSHRVESQLGVFAARDFPKGSIIGYCIAAKFHTVGSEGAAMPVMQNQQQGGVFAFRNREGCWQVVHPKAVGENGGSLYLGMHYIKDASHLFKFGSTAYLSASKKQNCCFCSDGSVQALKKIAKDVELLASHSSCNMVHASDKVSKELKCLEDEHLCTPNRKRKTRF